MFKKALIVMFGTFVLSFELLELLTTKGFSLYYPLAMSVSLAGCFVIVAKSFIVRPSKNKVIST